MKNCFVIIRNKKLNINEIKLESVLNEFSACGYYFDKVALVAYDDSQEIICQLKECKDNFDNAVIVCQSVQSSTVSQFLTKLYGGNFDCDGVMQSGDKSVFLFDAERLAPANFSFVADLLNKKYGLSFDKICIRCVGAPSKDISQAIEKASALSPELAFSVTDCFDEQKIEITYSSSTPKMVADGALRIFATALSDYIFALENITLAERLYQLLKLRRMKISVAESFTGGGICKKLVEVSGISEVFFEGLNTYSNEAKMQRLGVNELTLKSYGAVSAETAYEMAEGLIKTNNCDIAIATTGIAGPKSDNTNKPVGLAFISVGIKDNISVYKFNFEGNRESITKTAINHALFLAYKTLK
jgi:PncC family amidohydrolase